VPRGDRLWRCPKCGHSFVTRNLWHSCGRFRIADHLRGRPAPVRAAYREWVETARRCGRVTVYAQKTRIVFQRRVRFAGAVVRKDWIDGSMWLRRPVTHPLLVRSENFGRLGYGHHFRINSPDDIDAELASLMLEAYTTAGADNETTRLRGGTGARLLAPAIHPKRSQIEA